MRTYKAARRSSSKKPVYFRLQYEERTLVRHPETNEVTGEEVEQRSQLFRCRGEVSTLLLSEIAYNADLDVADPEAMKLVRAFFSNAFGEEEEDRAQYRLFFNLITRYGDDDLLMEVMAGLVEDFSGRPTQQRSLSQESQASAGESSKVVSLSAGTVEYVPGEVLESETETEAEGFTEPSQAASSS